MRLHTQTYGIKSMWLYKTLQAGEMSYLFAGDGLSTSIGPHYVTVQGSQVNRIHFGQRKVILDCEVILKCLMKQKPKMKNMIGAEGGLITAYRPP